MQTREFTARVTREIAAQFVQWPKTNTAIAWVFASMVAATGPASAGDPTATSIESKASANEEIVGIFTGTYANGLPVYRLPPINVTAHRNAVLAKIKRDEKLARSKQASAKTAATHKTGKGSATAAAEQSAPATCASCVPVAIIH